MSEEIQNTGRPLEELSGKNIVVYDLEIKNIIGGEVCKGWKDYGNMGISVGCLYDYKSGDYCVYIDDNMHELVERLNSADLVVAFNQIGFDNPLLRGMGFSLKPDSELPNYDMLLESRKGMGWTEGDRYPSGLRLDNHLEGIFGSEMKKTDDGANAPILYQEGKLGKVITYCLADVRREKMLFEHIWTKGRVRTNSGFKHAVAHPTEFLKENKNVTGE